MVKKTKDCEFRIFKKRKDKDFGEIVESWCGKLKDDCNVIGDGLDCGVRR